MTDDKHRNCWSCAHEQGGCAHPAYVEYELVPGLATWPKLTSMLRWMGTIDWIPEEMPPRETTPCPGWEAKR